MQLFSAIFSKNLKKFFAPQIIEILLQKVAHNPTRPSVFSPASFWLCGNEAVFYSFFSLIFEVVKLCIVNLESLDST